MAQTSLQGKTCNTNAALPQVGDAAPDFTLLNTKLKEKSLADFTANFTFIYVVPSLDTMVCADTSKKLNDLALTHSKHQDNVDFLVVSADLPFAQQRFCKQNKIKKLKPFSLMRSKQFAEDYGLLLIDGALAGLTARAVFIVDNNKKLLHLELVDDIAGEPDFEKAFTYLTT